MDRFTPFLGKRCHCATQTEWTVFRTNFQCVPYVQDDRGSQCVILEHLQYMTKVNIGVEPEHEDLPSFYWLPKLQTNVLLKRCLNCLLLA